jgi:ABC-type polysaccharide/polyol phosphate export permease
LTEVSSILAELYPRFGDFLNINPTMFVGMLLPAIGFPSRALPTFLSIIKVLNPLFSKTTFVRQLASSCPNYIVLYLVRQPTTVAVMVQKTSLLIIHFRFGVCKLFLNKVESTFDQPLVIFRCSLFRENSINIVSVQ